MSEESLDQLRENIRTHPNILKKEGSGWYSCICPVCESNRVTGGFLLDENDTIVYKCFRASCDSDSAISLEHPPSKKFKMVVMEKMGIQIPLDLLTKKNPFKHKLEKVEDDYYKEHYYQDVKINEGEIVKYTNIHKPAALDAATRLDQRCLDPNDFYYFTTGDYKNSPVLPFYFYGKMIGYQIITYKYITMTKENSNLVWLPRGRVPERLIIVEGALDALSFFPNAVGILGSKMSKEQAYILRNAKERIWLPDRSGGERFIEQAKFYGDKICVPPWKEKDLNAAVVKYGRFVVGDMIGSSTYSNYTKARIEFEMWRTE